MHRYINYFRSHWIQMENWARAFTFGLLALTIHHNIITLSLLLPICSNLDLDVNTVDHPDFLFHLLFLLKILRYHLLLPNLSS